MVNPRARRTSIGSMLNAKLSRPQLKAQAATLPPQLPPTRDWLRRNPLKRQRSPDPEKAKPAPHSSMRASSRGTRDDDSVTSGGGSPAPPIVRRNESRPTFKLGAISGIGQPRSIAASIGASGCRRTGNRRTAPRGPPGATIRRHKIRDEPCRERNQIGVSLPCRPIATVLQ